MLYTVASAVAAEHYATPIGETIELELDEGSQLALLSAGWLTTPTKKTGKES